MTNEFTQFENDIYRKKLDLLMKMNAKDLSLTSTEFLVLLKISTLTNGTLYLTQNVLSEVTGLSISSVKRSIRTLKDLSYLVKGDMGAYEVDFELMNRMTLEEEIDVPENLIESDESTPF